MYVHINEYEKYTFDYLGWTVSDRYKYNEIIPRHSQYSITITSPDITSQEELNNSSMRGKEIADIITMLIPISGLSSLNSPKFISFSNNHEIVDYKSAPNGWSTNFADIQSKLNSEKTNKMILDVTAEGFIHPSKLELSPLIEIQQMLEHYNDAEEHIKFLLFLYNSIATANDINVYMLIGKALEIIEAMYPHNNSNGTDRRIDIFYPELANVFQTTTIKDLSKLTNKRKETRHYVKDKHNIIPHESMSNEERIKLYRCSTSLIINVIRQAFGLSRLSIIFK